MSCADTATEAGRIIIGTRSSSSSSLSRNWGGQKVKREPLERVATDDGEDTNLDQTEKDLGQFAMWSIIIIIIIIIIIDQAA